MVESEPRREAEYQLIHNRIIGEIAEILLDRNKIAYLLPPMGIDS